MTKIPITRKASDSRAGAPYPVCLALCPDLQIPATRGACLSEYLQNHPEQCGNYPFLPDLAEIEEAVCRLQACGADFPETANARIVNPMLEVIEVNYLNLEAFIFDSSCWPAAGKAHVLVWVGPKGRNIRVQTADARDLLALKLVEEGIDSRTAAAEGGVSVGAVDDVLRAAGQKGLLIGPESGICRPADFPSGEMADFQYFISPTFTLQWHLTQACDLNCRHCYDRSDRAHMPWSAALRVAEDLYDFCSRHHVFGQVSFTGGNPMLYPYFDEIYQEAARRGFMTAVLGNPMPRAAIEKMLCVQMPEFYQVSLEGTRAHNDYIRGHGHFDKTIEFLELLGELGIYRMVMLTLTRDNMDQVLGLADQLEGRTELFTFNRLAAVGQGAQLASVNPVEYAGFLKRYMAAAEKSSCMGFKDNLFNLVRWQKGLTPGGGCTGFGCGAGFNFAALLPDGQVHACRKFPSLIGNIYQQGLEEIYYSPKAGHFRAGSAACAKCPIRPVCGACMAVVHGAGGDVFNDPDPCCWRCGN
ncbi:MAG: thio(seleno)oxazole modification radical SAM maturase SbtM [Desulfosalsimonas sp.]|uniref:thio(seleno)oxazole modification radical SAM maturase SbtM n=1 Tax=Desulfosalsimonas sp. TaxID=3073848 RepID=UPI0039707F36